ncbi:hypothetical protein Ga0061079_105136 [Apibacter mensalis]|uniref:Uncharacterized protein n=1 Tax=Apibacter mensalis TaxID=1586267 RepID=A0A0X3APW9_9FLAO|nr:hypothetical protein [Apibacter mensalis]CVK16177.1 hypothetical protein Ga0061079_105136 [Apibacter mensalis]
MKTNKNIKITGNLDILVIHNEDEFEGEISKWDEVLIHGDPEGLKSLGELLIKISKLNQEKIEDKYLPIGERVHFTLRPGLELSKNSNEVTVGRLDSKGTGKFYNNFIPKDISDATNL